MVGALLRVPYETVVAAILAGLNTAGFRDLRAAHLPVLRWPGPDGRRPSDLARDTRMTRQAMNYLLGELERLGYVEREEDPQDRRSKRVRLSERGHRAVQSMGGAVEAIEHAWEQELGAKWMGDLRALLAELNGKIAGRPMVG